MLDVDVDVAFFVAAGLGAALVDCVVFAFAGLEVDVVLFFVLVSSSLVVFAAARARVMRFGGDVGAFGGARGAILDSVEIGDRDALRCVAHEAFI